MAYCDSEPWSRRPRPLPADGPTDAIPGSAEKLRILCERAARREQLHHPGDLHLRDVRATADALAEDAPTPRELLAAIAGVPAVQLEPRKPRGRPVIPA